MNRSTQQVARLPGCTRRAASGARAFLASRLLRTAGVAAVVAASALAGSHAAYAQGAASATAAENDGPLGEVVVTGTRVVRDGYDAPTPVTVLSIEDITRGAPTHIADFVNKIPQLANNPGPHTTNVASGDGSTGVANANLRGIGANRTLVLLDGVRVVASSVNGYFGNGGAVDISGFPDALISRVDVVTGGASAAYGSDALAGVINFVLDEEFSGVKGDLTGGVTSHGDGEQYRVSLAGGTSFAGGRGHLLLSGVQYHNSGIPTADRDWLQAGWGLVQNPAYTATNGQPFYLIRPEVGSSIYQPGGLITAGPLRGTVFGDGGQPRTFSYGPLVGLNTTMSGGEWRPSAGALFGSINIDGGMDPEISRQNFFGRASFEVTESAKVYFQSAYSETKTEAFVAPSTSPNLTIQSDNPFIPASIQAQMASLGLTSFQISTYNTWADRPVTTNRRKFAQFLLGIRGDFDAFDTNWKWNGYASRSEARLDLSVVNNLNRPALALAIDVVRSPATGAPICRSTLTNPGNGCVPFNPMGINVNTQGAIDSVLGVSATAQKIRQDVFDLSLTGEPFSTWAGPVSLAFGVQHRTEDASGTDSITPGAFALGNYRGTNGSYKINEGFLETVVPLAKQMAWAESLDVSGAVRLTDYSTSGNVTTWKVGTTYQPISDIRFRATRSRDIRSPNMGELFSGGQSGSTTIRDNAAGGATVPFIQYTSGNPLLAPEEADTTGAGVVFQPRFMPGFSASFDYYKIEVGNAITQTSAQFTLDECVAGRTYYCQFVIRNAAGVLQQVNIAPINTASADYDGYDIEASHTTDLASLSDSLDGSLGLRLLFTRTLNMTVQQPTGTVLHGAGVHGSGLLNIAPKWRYSLTASYKTDAFTAAFTGRGISAGIRNDVYVECTSACPNVASPFFTIDSNRLAGSFWMDLSFTYHLRSLSAGDAEVTLAVENLADRDPPHGALISPTAGVYDQYGRAFRAGLRFRF